MMTGSESERKALLRMEMLLLRVAYSLFLRNHLRSDVQQLMRLLSLPLS
jgi:hypothetical protein